MKKFIVKLKKDDSIIGTFDSKVEASEFVTEAIDDNQIDTVFDVVCEEKEIDDFPTTFEDACKVLGIKASAAVNADDKGIAKSAVAFIKLAIIAKAWNKIDGFVPDFSNSNQWKYYPWFIYKDTRAGFVCAYSHYAASYTGADVGSRLCFKSESVASKFGKTFESLYNELFLD